MKNYRWIAPALLLALIVGPVGCARRYVMTMNNGTQVTSKGKPKLDQGTYKFKDVTGQERMVSAGRVREIAPASMSSPEKTRFNPSTSR